MQIVDPDIERYAHEHTTPTTQEMEALEREARATLPFPEMLSGLVVSRLLETLVWAVHARLVVEVGTYAGYAALSMAAGLAPGGRVVTLELDPDRAAFARRHIAASPYADRVEVREGPALEALEQLPGPFDFVFIDADKTGYPDYYEAALAKLSDRGLIAVDNTLQDGHVLGDTRGSDDRAMMEFDDRVAADDRVVCVLLTVRDGVTLIRRR